MKLKPSQKSFLTLESVAMTDIVMNLFIFFFISFSLLYTFNPQKESKIQVKLPEAASKNAKEGDPLVVTVTSGNEIYVGAKRVLAADMKREFAAAHARESGVVVRADKAASVETLVQVLDGAKQNGVEKLGVAIRER